jgi:hypothetical protein
VGKNLYRRKHGCMRQKSDWIFPSLKLLLDDFVFEISVQISTKKSKTCVWVKFLCIYIFYFKPYAGFVACFHQWFSCLMCVIWFKYVYISFAAAWFHGNFWNRKTMCFLRRELAEGELMICFHCVSLATGDRYACAGWTWPPIYSWISLWNWA